MISTAEKTTKHVMTVQQKAARDTFFRKAGNETFFGSKKEQSFFNTPVQAKLTVSSPDDPQEKEADAVADKVMRMPGPLMETPVPTAIQEKLPRKEKEEEEVQAKAETTSTNIIQCKEEPEEKLQANSGRSLSRMEDERADAKLLTGTGSDPVINRKNISLYHSDILQCSGRGPPQPSIPFHQDLSASKGSGNPLPGDTRTSMESRFNADFSNVRIHTGASAEQLSGQINAQAFTHGNDIYFNKGKYAPGTSSGNLLLAHELTHTVQQGASHQQAVSPKPVLKPGFKTVVSGDTETISPHTAVSRKQHTRVYRYPGTMDLIQASSIDLQGSGSSLSSEAREYFGDSFKTDVSDIRVHADFESALLCRSRRVPVFVDGRHIIFDPSRYSPDSEAGGILLAKQVAESLKQRSINVPGLESQLNQGIKEIKAGEVSKPKPPVTSEKLSHVPKDKKKSTLKGKESKKGKAGSKKRKPKSGKAEGGFGKAGKPKPNRSPASPEEDPAFHKVVKKASARAKDQEKHDDPVVKADHAQKAATAVPDEAQSKAQKRKTDGMEEVAKEDKPFDEESFKAELLQKIEAVTPKNLEAATEFKENNKIGEVKSAMGKKVVSEKEKTAGPVEDVTQQPLQVNEADNKTAHPLPPILKGNQPQSIGAKDAAPKPKLNQEISMEEQSKSLDDEMKANNVTEDQLAKSNEPSFTNALQEKKAAQKDARDKPVQYRKNEAQELKAAQAASTADATRQMTSMFTTRGKNFDAVVKQQQTTKSKDEQEREAVVNKIQGMYQKTEAVVNSLLTMAELTANSIFDSGSEKARQDFENYVDQEMRAYKRRRYSGFWGGLRWAKDKLFGMPDAVNKFYVQGRKQYLAQMNVVIGRVAHVITTNLNAAKQAIRNGKKEIETYVSGLEGSLKNVGKEAAESIQDKFDSLEQSVNDKKEQLIDGLARKYVANLKKLDDRITELKEANKGLVQKAIGFLKEVWKVIKNLYDLFKTILSRIVSVIGLIISDPGKFFDNLGTAFKQGFDRFQNRIGEHLENGLMIWLSAQLGTTGLKMPDKFDVSAIFGLVLQVLGVTYENIRERAVILIGEERVALLEKTVETGADIFQRIKAGGLGAVWDMIKDKFTDFKDMIWEAIKSFIKTAVVKAAITFILSLLNPIAAFIKACMAIYQFIMMLVRMKDRIIDLLNSILDAVAMIAQGSVDKAAAAVENAFAKSIPIIIGFLAALLGLSDIGSRVRGIILRIREKVNKLIDMVLSKAYSIVSPLIETAMRVKNKGKELIEKGKEKGKALIEKGKEKLRGAVGGGGTPQERLDKGLMDAQKAANKFAGKPVGAVVLRPLLGAIKLKYGFESLDVEAREKNWAIVGQVNPKKDILTNVPVGPGKPYIKTDRIGEVRDVKSIIFEGGVLSEQLTGGPDFAYVGNVPTVPSKDPATIAKQYLSEGFADENDAKSRFSLVIGVNTYEDLAGKNLPKLKKTVKWNGFPLGVFSFYWQPYWSDGKTDVTFDAMKKIYNESNADQKAAIDSAEEKDARDQKVIPYGEIRNLIITHPFTQKFTSALKQRVNQVYIHVGDDDAVSLKVHHTEGLKVNAGKIATHLFDRYDAFLKDAGEDLPAIACGGYKLRIPIPGGYSVNKKNLTTIANDLDMAIRTAMARLNPRAVYFPEPNTIIRVDGGNLVALFSGGSGEGDRMVTKLLRERGGGKLAFDERLAIVTDSSRFNLEEGGSGETTDKIGTAKTLTESQLKKLFEAQAQSHARPKTFADRMVEAYKIRDKEKQKHQRPALDTLMKTLFPNLRFGYDPKTLKQELARFNPYDTPLPPDTVDYIASEEKRAEALELIRNTALTIKNFLLSLIS